LLRLGNLMLFTFAYLHLMLNIVAVIFAFRFPAIPAKNPP